MLTTLELLTQLQADNLKLTKENLRLRHQRHKLRKAFALYVNTHFIQVRSQGPSTIRVRRERA